MKNLILAIIISTLTGCFAQTEEPEPAPVECAFPQGVCPRGNIYVEHVQFDDGKGCVVMSAACYPAGTPAERAPADCYSRVSLACEDPTHP